MISHWPTQKIVAALLVAGLVAYVNAIFNPFVHDDIVFIEKNPTISQFNPEEIFLKPHSPVQVSPIVNSYYRPFLEIVYRLEYKFFFLNAALYHLVNIFLHSLNGILVFFLANFLLPKRRLAAFLIAIFFLIHPVQTEAVACIAGISNLIFAFFLLLSLNSFIISSIQAKRNLREFSFYVFSLFCFLLALFSKEQAVIMPFLILMYEWYAAKSSIIPLRPRIVRVLGFFLILFSYLYLRKIILNVSLTAMVPFNEELVLRIGAIPRTLLQYLAAMFFPLNLHYYRSTDVLKPLLFPFIGLAVAMGVILFIINRATHFPRKVFLFSLGWFFITLLPTLNILPLINEYSFILSAEHFLYLPLIGFLLFMAEMITPLISRKVFWGRGIIIFWIVLSLALTWRQNSFWKNEVVLFERALQFEPQLGRVHILLAKAYYFDHRYEASLEEYQKALEIISGYIPKVKNPEVEKFCLGFVKGIHFEMAHVHEAQSQWPESIKHYEEALKIDPYDDVFYNNLAMNYLMMNDYAEAKIQLGHALALNENNLMAKSNLAIIYAKQGHHNEAKKLWEEVLKKDSHFVAAKENLEKMLSGQGGH